MENQQVTTETKLNAQPKVPQGPSRKLDAPTLKAIKATDEYQRISDGGGLFLMVSPRTEHTDGTMTWQTHYRRGGKRHLVTLGHYPQVGLAQARTLREQLRGEVRNGGDPNRDKRQQKRTEAIQASTTFESVALKWHEAKQDNWAGTYASQVLWRFKRYAFPTFGSWPIGDIRRRDVMELLTKVVKGNGTYKASRSQANLLRQHLVLCFRWAVKFYPELIENNPATDLAEDYPVDSKVRHPAVLTLEDARKVLAAIESRKDTSPQLKLLHRFQALTGVRPSEARTARWCEVVGNRWTIPAERMKGRRGRKVEHVTILAPQALECWEAARTLCGLLGAPTGPNDYVFPGVNSTGVVSRAALSERMQVALAGTPMEGKHVPHGWRSTFSTILNERHPAMDKVVDSMLAHVRNDVEGRYKRTKYWVHVQQLAEEWAKELLVGAPDACTMVGLPKQPANVFILHGEMEEGLRAHLAAHVRGQVKVFSTNWDELIAKSAGA